jgi:hypothetical protein
VIKDIGEIQVNIGPVSRAATIMPNFPEDALEKNGYQENQPAVNLRK